MQFEQLNMFDSVPSVNFNTLDNDGKIYCKVDWLTVMFFDSSMNHVLRWLKLDGCVTDFCSAAFQQSRGYDEVFKFMYNGIMLETSSFNFYGQDIDLSIFDIVVPKIRLELSGSALDYLRSIGVDMNSYRFVVPDLPDGGSYHFTRCDWAFDFINYMPDFVDRMIHHCTTHSLQSGRIPLASTKGAIGCKLVTGNQKTVYLGSPQSDRMLRVYDKRLQSINLGTQTYVKPNPYGDPDSWFRIEWQTRNKMANNLVLDKSLDFKHILKLIFDKYAFADGTVNNHNVSRSTVDFWLDLFNWTDLETRIIQNAKYVQYESPEEKVIASFKSVMIRTFIFTYSLLGREAFEKMINDYLRGLDLPDPVSHRRSLAFLSRLNEFQDFELPTEAKKAQGLFNFLGRLQFKL